MNDHAPRVLHVTGPDIPAERIERLRALLTGTPGQTSRVLHLGRRIPALDRLPCVVETKTDAAGTLLGQSLPAGLATQPDRPIIHVWSVEASAGLPGGLSQLWQPAPLAALTIILDVDLPLSAKQLDTCAALFHEPGNVHCVCATQTAQETLVAHGIPTTRCHVIRDEADVAAINDTPRDAIRKRLGLAPESAAVLALPPIQREAGTLLAAWATMLAAQIHTQVRFVLPGSSREARRTARLVEACRHEWVLCHAPDSLHLAELLAAADVAIYLPAEPSPVSSLVEARSAGVPIIATNTPGNREVLSNAKSARLCESATPKTVAKLLVEILDDQPNAARNRGTTQDAAQHSTAAYQRLYEMTTAGDVSATGR